MNDETPSYMKAVGGRKMFLALLSVLVGGLVEVYSTNGMSTSFAGLLAAVVGAFSAANVFTTVKTVGSTEFETTPAPTPDTSAIEAKIDDLTTAYQADMKTASETIQALSNAIQETNKRVIAVMSTRKNNTL